MDQLPPIYSPEPGAHYPGPTAERHLRRAAELTAELIDLVGHVRSQLDEPVTPVPDPPPSGRGLARGEMRDAFAAARATPRRKPRGLTDRTP